MSGDDGREPSCGSLRATVQEQGARLRKAAPTAAIASLVAAACAPVMWPLLDVPKSVEAAVALFGGTGGGYIGAFLQDRIDRLRQVPASQAELQDTLERELLTGLDTDDRLRADVAALLEHALTPIQREQRINIDIAREILVKINVLMQRQTAPAPVPPSPGELAEGQEPTPGPCPYMGLAAFQAEDAEWFFGREQLVADLLARLSEVPFLAVVGPSGSGKSSALRAGLLPAFLARHAARRQQLDGPADSGGVSSERAGRPRCARA